MKRKHAADYAMERITTAIKPEKEKKQLLFKEGNLCYFWEYSFIHSFIHLNGKSEAHEQIQTETQNMKNRNKYEK